MQPIPFLFCTRAIGGPDPIASLLAHPRAPLSRPTYPGCVLRTFFTRGWKTLLPMSFIFPPAGSQELAGTRDVRRGDNQSAAGARSGGNLRR